MWWSSQNREHSIEQLENTVQELAELESKISTHSKINLKMNCTSPKHYNYSCYTYRGWWHLFWTTRHG